MAKKKGRLKQNISVYMICIFLCFTTSAVAVSIISDPRIASIIEFTSDCVDDLGNVRADGDVWVTNGGCDRNTCFHGKQKKFLINHRCRDITADENPDNLNCHPVADTTKAFPGCCPHLWCATASPLTTLSPTACYDRSSAFACSFWYNMTGGCQRGVDIYNDRLYNYTLIGCRKLCRHC